MKKHLPQNYQTDKIEKTFNGSVLALLLFFSANLTTLEAQCPVTFPNCGDEFVTIIDLDDPTLGIPFCGEGTASFSGEVTNGGDCQITTQVCKPTDAGGMPTGPISTLDCHKFVIRRDMNSGTESFMTQIGQGQGCNGELDATFEIQGGTCEQLSCGGSQTLVTYTFDEGSNEIILYACLNSSASVSLCGLCIMPPPCEFTVTCPTDLDLGTYDCNQLDLIPDCPTLMANGRDLVVDNADGDYGIDVGDTPCGNIVVLCEDNATPDVCTGRNILRTITIYDDLNDNGTLDAGEDSQECVFTIEITMDDTPPSNVFCPAGGDIGCNPSADLYAPGTAQWDDECGIMESGVDPGSPVSTGGCTYEVVHVHYAIDNCGARSECEEIFTFERATAPQFTNLPGDEFLGCNPSSLPSCDPGVTASNECGPVMHSCNGGAITNNGCLYTQIFTYEATACGLTTTETVTYTWEIVNEPIINGLPAGGFLGCNPTSLPTCIDDLTAENECRDNITVSCSAGTITNNGCLYTQEFTYTATDCGKSTTETVTYTWEIVNEPIINGLPAGGFLGCNPTSLPTCIDDLTAENECRDNITVSCSAGTITNNGCLYTQEFTYTATDCGKSTTETVTYTWEIVTAPVFDNCTDEVIDLGCNPTSLPACDPSITASNNCGDVAVACNPGPIVIDLWNMSQTITYEAEACGQKTICTKTYIWTEDKNKPVFHGVPADISLPCDSPVPAWPDVIAVDIESGELEVTTRSSEIGAGCFRRIRREWRAEDECGNVVKKIQNIYFSDEEAPIIQAPADTTIQCGQPLPDEGYIASDNCSLYDVKMEQIVSDPDACEYTIIRIWTAIDSCQNMSRDTQIIQIIDTVAPIITPVNPMLTSMVNGSEMVMYGCEEPRLMMEDLAVTDECCDATYSTSDQLLANGVCSDMGYYRIWKCSAIATDGAGNTSEYFFYVSQYDTTAPVIMNVPEDQLVECGEEIPSSDSVYVIDDCYLDTIPEFDEEIIYDPTDSLKFAVLRRWWQVDLCGNRGQDAQVIAVCDFDTDLISSSISGVAWNDDNLNGLRDSTESGRNDVIVHLLTADTTDPSGRSLLKSTVTSTLNNQRGAFLFDYLAAGEYYLQFEIPDYLDYTAQNIGMNDSIDSDVDSSGLSTQILLVQQDNQTTYSAGLVPKLPKTDLASLPSELFSENVNPDKIERLDEFNVYPNPFYQSFTLDVYMHQKDLAEVLIFDHLGRLLNRMKVHLEKGDNILQMDLKDAASGTYFLKIVGSDWNNQKMVIKAN